MIKLKSKIIKTDDKNQYVRIKTYKAKNTSTAEHICVINTLITSILDNDDSISLNELCKIIKENQKIINKGE